MQEATAMVRILRRLTPSQRRALASCASAVAQVAAEELGEDSFFTSVFRFIDANLGPRGRLRG